MCMLLYPFFVNGFICIGLILAIMDQKQSSENRTLKRQQVGGLPLIYAIVERMKLKDILYKYLPVHGNEDIPAVETLMLLVYNLILGEDPLYELQEWVESIDFMLGDVHVGGRPCWGTSINI